jgi:hypothetical protein
LTKIITFNFSLQKPLNQIKPNLAEIVLVSSSSKIVSDTPAFHPSWLSLRKKPERTTDHGQAIGQLYHLWLRSRMRPFCILQSRERTHAVLVIGLYDLLGNPTTCTKLIEPPGPFNCLLLLYCKSKCGQIKCSRTTMSSHTYISSFSLKYFVQPTNINNSNKENFERKKIPEANRRI